MKKRIPVVFISLITITTVLCGCVSGVKSDKETVPNESSSTIENGSVLKHDLKLIVTSDIHAGVEDNFTLPYVYELRKKYDDEGNYTLLIDNGDLLQGGLLSSESKGEDLIDIMNTVGYDIMTMGNHDFDYGMEQFLKNASKLKNPYISCNFNRQGQLVFEPCIFKEYDGMKFAFIGITTPETFTTSHPIFFQDDKGDIIYDFYQGNDGKKLYSKIQETVDDVKEKGADYVIAVAHVGAKETSVPYRYNDIISNVSGIDVFLDGHSHDHDQVTMKDKADEDVFRMGVGTKLSSIGVVTFTTKGEIKHELLTYEKETYDTEIAKIDNVVSKLIGEKNAKIGDKMNTVIGKTDFDLVINDPNAKDSAGKPIRIVRRMETNLGVLIADAFKERAGADIGLMNGGGVRENIESGEITAKDVKSVLPFDNTVCLLEVTGQQILDAMEWGCHVTPAESGGFPQVSGITFELDTSIKDPCQKDANGICIGINGERRVKNLKINGDPVVLDKKYKLATLPYLYLDHGDGYTAFDDCNVLEIAISEDYYLLVSDYIKENLNGVIPEKYSDVYVEERIKIS